MRRSNTGQLLQTTGTRNFVRATRMLVKFATSCRMSMRMRALVIHRVQVEWIVLLIADCISYATQAGVLSSRLKHVVTVESRDVWHKNVAKRGKQPRRCNAQPVLQGRRWCLAYVRSQKGCSPKTRLLQAPVGTMKQVRDPLLFPLVSRLWLGDC